MVQIPPEFKAQLESYRGPLDLLLFLIKKEEIDIFDIPIARIVEQYQIYLEILREIDPNLCGEFLVTAAQLMEIKSKLLLPREQLSDDEPMEDPRLELVRQLLEYKKYKERAFLLQRRLAERERRYERPPLPFEPGEAEELEAIDLGNLSIWDLFTAFHRIQLAISAKGPHRIVARERPVEEYIAQVRNVLSAAPARTCRFEELFGDASTVAEAVGIFLAILEMAKQHWIAIRQEELFGPIEVRLRSEEEVARLRAEEEAEPGVDPAEKFLLEGEGREALLGPIEPAGESLPNREAEAGPIDPAEADADLAGAAELDDSEAKPAGASSAGPSAAEGAVEPHDDRAGPAEAPMPGAPPP